MKTLVGADYPKNVIPLIEKAQHTIDIVCYEWRWYQDQAWRPTQQFNAALVNAGRRGVKIRAVLNKGDILPILKNVGISARILPDKRLIHSKLLLIDRKIAVLGSHNFTHNAFTRNIETSVILELDDEENRLMRFFDNLYGLKK